MSLLRQSFSKHARGITLDIADVISGYPKLTHLLIGTSLTWLIPHLAHPRFALSLRLWTQITDTSFEIKEI